MSENQTAQNPAIPQPAGTDENGNPFWIINNQKYTWAQIQPMLAAQQNQSTRGGGGGSPEQIPQMPQQNFEAPVVNPEANPEVVSQPNFERQNQQPEKTMEQTRQQDQSQAAPPPLPPKKDKPKPTSFIGDSAKLTSVSTDDPVGMKKFYDVHKQGKGNPKQSSTFLAVLFEKILRSLVPN